MTPAAYSAACNASLSHLRALLADAAAADGGGTPVTLLLAPSAAIPALELSPAAAVFVDHPFTPPAHPAGRNGTPANGGFTSPAAAALSRALAPSAVAAPPPVYHLVAEGFAGEATGAAAEAQAMDVEAGGGEGGAGEVAGLHGGLDAAVMRATAAAAAPPAAPSSASAAAAAAAAAAMSAASYRLVMEAREAMGRLVEGRVVSAAGEAGGRGAGRKRARDSNEVKSE